MVQALLTRQLCGGSRCAFAVGNWGFTWCFRLAEGSQAELYIEGMAAFSSLSQFLMLLLICGCKKIVLIPYLFH